MKTAAAALGGMAIVIGSLLAGAAASAAPAENAVNVGVDGQVLIMMESSPKEGQKVARIRILDRRKAGLTVKNVVRIIKDLNAQGALQQYVEDTGNGKEVNVSGLAVSVATRLAEENPQGWEDIDWDEALAWLEAVIEMLIKYLPIIISLFA